MKTLYNLYFIVFLKSIFRYILTTENALQYNTDTLSLAISLPCTKFSSQRI